MRFVIQVVASERVKFSMLLSLCPKSLRSPVTESELEALVEMFANVDQNNGLSLNAEGWRCFDPYSRFFYFSSSQVASALDNANSSLAALKFKKIPASQFSIQIIEKVIKGWMDHDGPDFWASEILQILKSSDLESAIFSLRVYEF